jgi:putative hydrolase of the HAD superfamily
MLITSIAFDIGNVLFKLYHAKTRAALSEYAGVTPEFVKETVFGQLHDDIERGLMTPEEFRRRASLALGKDIPFDFFSHAWNDVFDENREIIPLLETLQRSYTLLLISNTDPLHFSHYEQSEAIGRFFADSERRVLSFESGARKPEQEIYHELVAKGGGKPSEILYFDDVPEFCEAFRAMGGNSINYNAKTDSIDSLKKKFSEFGVSS